MHAERRSQSITLFGLSREWVTRLYLLLSYKCSYLKTCQSIASIDLGVTNRYQWVEKKNTNTESIFKNTESLNNGHQWCIPLLWQSLAYLIFHLPTFFSLFLTQKCTSKLYKLYVAPCSCSLWSFDSVLQNLWCYSKYIHMLSLWLQIRSVHIYVVNNVVADYKVKLF